MGISPSTPISAGSQRRHGYPQIALDTTSLDESVGMEAGAIQYRNTNPLVGRQGWDIRSSRPRRRPRPTLPGHAGAGRGRELTLCC